MAQEQRTHMLRVRFSDEEWNTLQQQAQDAECSMSSLVRDHLGKLSIRNRSDEKQRLILLNRVNANLNMIARWVNIHKDAADTIEVVSHLMALQRTIEDLSS